MAAESKGGSGASYLEARIGDGTTQTTFASTTTGNTGASPILGVRVGLLKSRTCPGTYYWDDVKINDNLGPCNNTWPSTTRNSVALHESCLSPGGAPWYYSLNDIEALFYIIDKAGAKFSRIDGHWDKVETPSKGTFDWSVLDKLIDAMATRGIEPVVLFDGIPTWANDGTVNHPPTDPQDYADFCTAIVARYKDRCTHWTIMSEPNGSWFWGGTNPDVAIYSSMLKLAYAAIKAEDPNAVVIGGDLAALDSNGTTHVSPVDWLTGMYTNGCKGYFDQFGFHPYCDPQIDPNDGGSTNPANNGWNDIDNIRAVLAANGDGDMPIRIGEYGNYTTPATGGISEANQSAWMTSAFNLAKAQKNLIMFGIYNATNDADSSSTDEDNYGIATRALAGKTAFATYQTNAQVVVVPVNDTAPVVSGTFAEGEVLEATRGLWTELPAAWAYQWWQGTSASPISGATSRTYTVQAGDIGGGPIGVTVTASNEAGDSTPQDSSNTITPTSFVPQIIGV